MVIAKRMDRKHIREYIAEQNQQAAIELDERIDFQPAVWPKSHHGRMEETREVVIHPHFVLVCVP